MLVTIGILQSVYVLLVIGFPGGHEPGNSLVIGVPGGHEHGNPLVIGVPGGHEHGNPLVIGVPGGHEHGNPFRCFDHGCHPDEICMITLHKEHMQASCHPDHDPHAPPHLQHMRLCSEILLNSQNHVDGYECFCNNEECTYQVLNYVYGHTNPPPDKDFLCDTYPCRINEICRMNNIDGAIRGQCMNDPSQHGINVRFGCPVFLRTGQECYCNTNRCVNEARPATTTSTTTTTTAPLPSGVPTLNPLCIDHDTRCASFKDRLCHATAHAYVIATCARTCNRCDEFIAPASTIQQTTSTTTTPKTTPRTLQPTTSTASLTTNTKPVKCNMCGDIDNYIPCFSRDVFRNQSSDCPAGLNFCMTDIFTDADGNSDLFKRCVTEQTCNTKWTNDSAKSDYCRKYGVVISDNAYECHFCCTGDGCNTNIKPSDTTLVVPHAFLIVGK